MELSRPLKLHSPVQHYSWGMRGGDSLVARLRGEEASSQPFAELWMGAHPSAPSKIAGDDRLVPLDQAIAGEPQAVLGKEAVQKFGPKLPFLFKVLSIRTALSIQAHPDKVRAGQLHARDPLHYPDDNHKPELAIAVSPVELLYGFRHLREVRENFQRLPELTELLREDERQRLNSPAYAGDLDLLQDLYTSVLEARPENVARVHRSMIARLHTLEQRTPEDEWVLRLAEDYTEGDVGLFSFYLLNFLRLQPDEAIFVGPNMPHAYLHGDVVECMANSDNVVRAGLTGKFKDVETLLEMLHFRPAAAEILDPPKDENGRRAYATPAGEFFVESFEGRSGEERTFSSSGKAVELLFCLCGSGQILCKSETQSFSAGDAFLIPAAAGSIDICFTGGQVFRVSLPAMGV
jgi:mannose-6-phosphate isomerase